MPDLIPPSRPDCPARRRACPRRVRARRKVRPPKIRLPAAALLLTLLLPALLAPASGSGGTARAQGLFAPAVIVNDSAITGYELRQRVQLLRFLRTPGDLEEEARRRLIDERLQAQAARQAGIVPDADEIRAGVAEFAGRLDLDADSFLARLAEEGIAAESFLDFVRAGLAWRSLVRQRFGAQVEINDAEVERAIALEGARGSARVRISEIFLPTNTPENAAISRELAPQIARLRSIEEFSEAARRFSAGATRRQGGQVEGWVMLEDLPPLIRPVLLKMRPGEVTEPIEIPDAIALFQLRAIQEVPARGPENPLIDYASYLIEGGRSPETLARAAEVRARVDVCDDLYGLARGEPPERLERRRLPLAEIPAEVALELARLDPGESSTALTRDDGQTLVFLMLCARQGTKGAPDREAVRERLRNERLSALAQGYLDELRAAATIVTP